MTCWLRALRPKARRWRGIGVVRPLRIVGWAVRARRALPAGARRERTGPPAATPAAHAERPDALSGPDAPETAAAAAPDVAAELSEEGVPPFVVLDVETRRSAAEVGGWHRAGDMGVSVAVLYDSRDGQFHTYRQEELFACFERLRSAPLVVASIPSVSTTPCSSLSRAFP